MSDQASEKPKRRVRYRGRNPRHFHEKYKELEPERYPLDLAKVLSAGRTPAGTHRPIMVDEILGVLRPRAGDVAVDCTLGYGGHARALLAAIGPGGRLLGMDVDPIELEKTETRLRGLGYPERSIATRCGNFAGLARFVAEEAPGGADVLVADLGVSSMQIDDPGRGFSFKVDGPLDMRMNPTRGRPALGLLSDVGELGLTRILVENADLPDAEELARAVYRAHLHEALTTTQALRAVLREA